MDFFKAEHNKICHLLAMPYPGRGHINPMMNFCKILASRQPRMQITFVLTEEWLSFIGNDSKPDNIRFATIPNCLPSELVRAKDIHSFLEAAMTKMVAPFEQLLDQLEPKPSVIIYDSMLLWVVELGNQRNIPVASFYTMSATVFSVLHRFHLLQQNGHYPVDLSEMGEYSVNYIPGISSIRLADLAQFVDKKADHRNLHWVLEAYDLLPRAQYVLLPTVSELETQVIEALKKDFSYPFYTIGPLIPYLKLEDYPNINDLDYLQWLDKQSSISVLYVSMGSFLSVSSTQMDEIAAGLSDSGVPFLWVARGEASRLRDMCGNKGIVVTWCDQLRLLSHPSVGGFWSHCGWSSTMEGVFSGLPFLTFPLVIDQFLSSKMIVEDWKIGCRVKREKGEDVLVTRGEISSLVRKFMNLECSEGKEMRKRARELQKLCKKAIAKDGSSEHNITAFIRDLPE